MAHVQNSRSERLGPGAQDPGQGLQEIDDRAKNTTERSREAWHEGKEKAGEGADRTARAAQRGGEKASEAVHEGAEKVNEGAEKAGEGANRAAGAAKEGGENFSEGAKDAAGNAADNFGENIKNFASQAKDAAGDAARIAGDESKKVAGNVQSNTKAAGDQLKEGAGRAKDAAGDVGEKAKEGAQSTRDHTSYEARDIDSKYSVEPLSESKHDAGETDKNESTDSLEGDYEIVKSLADDKESDAEKSKDDVGSIGQQIGRIDLSDTGKVSSKYTKETERSFSSSKYREESDRSFSSLGEGGEKTKDALPLQSTTVGKEMKDNDKQAFTNVKSQPVYTADDSSKSSYSTGTGAGGTQSGFGVAGKDVDLKVKDTDYKPDQSAYPAEYGAADDEFVTRTSYKEEGKNDEKDEKNTDDEPGTLVKLTNKIAGMFDE